MNSLTQFKNAAILPVLIAVTLVWFALSPHARAICQDACLTNDNTVQGDDALISLTVGTENTAIGFNALFSNTTGGDNTAVGASALEDNVNGFFNTAVGFNTMVANTSGSFNTATGLEALSINTTGGANSAYGFAAINNNTTGNNNTAVGTDALQRNTTGSNNIALGYFAGAHIVDGGFNIDIGNQGVGRDVNTIRIGTQRTQTATFIAGISGATVPTGVAVIIDTDGHLGTTTSSARYKDAIKPMDKSSEAILALKPVTFRYKQELDPDGIPQFGLVAEEVEKVNPDLVARDEQGKPYTVRYEAVNAMLLNEFLKEHCKVEQQEKALQQEETTIAQLKSTVAKQEATAMEQQKQIEALTAGLKRLSAQIQLSKAPPEAALNNR